MRLFSVEEANALVPLLRRCLAKIADERKAIGRLAPQIEQAQKQAHLGGGAELGPSFLEHLLSLQREVAKIESVGVLVKDYDLGLCDFPHERDGQMVYLCWKPNEDRVSWWHEVEAGFAGRQPLD